MLPDELFAKLLDLITTGTYLAQVAGLVLIVTQILKGFWTAIGKTPIEGDAARWLTVLVQVIFWGVYALLQSRGLDGQFTQWAKTIEAIWNILFPAIVTGYAANRSYNILHANAVPGFHKPASQAWKEPKAT